MLIGTECNSQLKVTLLSFLEGEINRIGTDKNSLICYYPNIKSRLNHLPGSKMFGYIFLFSYVRLKYPPINRSIYCKTGTKLKH